MYMYSNRAKSHTLSITPSPPPPPSLALREPKQTIITRADKVDRWQHDLYIEAEQKPKEQWEKDRVSTYSGTPLKGHP